MTWEKIDLNLINHGEVVAQINHHIGEAINDSLDPNKPANKVRRIILKLEILPSEDRSQAAIKATVETKFPSDSPCVDLVSIHREKRQGFVNTDEQLNIFNKVIEIDNETVEVMSLIHKSKNND